jgi:hypothetical protein
MMDIAAPAKPSAPKAVTTKHLAYMLAEQHHLSKKQSLEMMEELIGMITKHSEEGRAGEDCRARHPASAQTRRPHGTQSRDG